MSGKKRVVVTPSTAKYRLFVWMETGLIPDQQVRVIARDDDYFLGALQSACHVKWSLAAGSTLENRPRYTATQCFETFPFPWPPGTEPSEEQDPRVQAIADAARELVRLRDNWLNPEKPDAIEPRQWEADLKKRTLTILYNKRQAGEMTWLDNAHRALDEAVFAAYGWPSNLSDQEILAQLLALNHERAAAAPEQARG